LFPCFRTMSSWTPVWRNLARRSFWTWIRKRPHQASLPKDDGLDEVSEAILLALFDGPFSSVRYVWQTVRRTCVPKSIVDRQLVDSLHFTVRHQPSSLGSFEILRQSEGKSSRVVDPTSRPPVVYPTSRMGLHIAYSRLTSESWF
jgi:hypothetical protein